MLSRKVYNYLINKLRYVHTPKAIKKRERYYKKLIKKAGDNIIIKAGVIINDPENLVLGNNISIQENCFLSCYGGLTIGDDVSIATKTNIFTTSHDYESGIIRKNKLQILPTKIGSNVWIGAGVQILGGITIEDNVVIGAGSVVNKDCKSNGIYAGVPAKRVKEFGKTG